MPHELAGMAEFEVSLAVKAELTMRNQCLAAADPELHIAVIDELTRQRNRLELIASENLVSQAVLEAAGSVLTNKYAEGYGTGSGHG